MGLGLSLNIASSGLRSIESSLATTSQNVTNASTEGYVSESPVVSSSVVGGQGVGVSTGGSTLTVSKPLQDALYAQNAKVAGLTAMNSSLSNLSAVQGTTSANSSTNNPQTIGTLTDNLQGVKNSLISLSNSPQQSAAQSTVVANAQTLVSNIHTLSSVYQSQRQGAQDNIASTVSSVNSDLTNIGQLSKQIMLAKSFKQGTADLENKRYETMSSLSSKLGVSFNEKPNGDMIVTTQDGTQLPTRPDQINQPDSTQSLPSSQWPLSTTDASIAPSMYHSQGQTDGGIPGIMLNGKDVTSHLTGGTLGANITMRDSTYPNMQAQLDSFSYTLANRFNASGLPLFSNGSSQPLSSDPTKTAPNGLVGLSNSISVNQKYSDTPSQLTTDGNGNKNSVAAVTNTLSQAFANSGEAVSGKLGAPTSALGPNGGFSTGYSGEQGLSQLATTLTSNQAATIQSTTTNLSSATSVQTALSSKVSNVSGVDVNNQMSTVVSLQNSYTANAKVVSAVQSMFSALLNAVQ